MTATAAPAPSAAPGAGLSPYPEFKSEWLTSITAGEPSTVELGRRFAVKLVEQWLDRDSDGVEVIYCDGTGDGGIDAAWLDEGDSAVSGPDDAVSSGDTWYLVQSKYGSAFAGVGTVLEEGQKLVDTLSGQNTRLSSLSAGLVQRLQEFRANAGERDRIVLLYATIDPPTNDERRAMDDVRALGRARLGALFDVETVSLETIYGRMVAEALQPAPAFKVPLRATLTTSGEGLRIGAVSLVDLYKFLKAYRQSTDDLDRLYEKNVRRFLGSRGKVNARMQQTLRDEPERFGLYNNGITIVVRAVDQGSDGSLLLEDPYVVNGCQTTRSIWEVCRQKLDSGGTGAEAREQWARRAAAGVVVTKVVTVGAWGEELLREITKNTNSQNRISEKDFLTLNDNLTTWAREVASRYGLYLEVQRGGWDSMRAWQKQHPATTPFTAWANAFDLIKVYGAGLMGEAGLAFAKNPPFLPGGEVFNRITGADGGFGPEAIWAAYRLQLAADEAKFGRGAQRQSRKQTRYLFYFMLVQLLRSVLTKEELPAETHAHVTAALTALTAPGNEEAFQMLVDTALEAIDEYLNADGDDSVFKEPGYRQSNDLNRFLKAEKLGRSDEFSPRLRDLVADYGRMMARVRQGWGRAPRAVIADAVRARLTERATRADA